MPDTTEINTFVTQLGLNIPMYQILVKKIEDPAIQGPTFNTHKKSLESKRVDLRTKCLYLLRNLDSELKDMRDEHVATWSERMRVPLWYRKAHGILKDGQNTIL
jgi:hypothetical protein